MQPRWVKAAVLTRSNTSPVVETLQGAERKKPGLDKIGSFLFFKFSMFMKAEIRVAEPEDKLLQRAILIEMIMMKVLQPKLKCALQVFPPPAKRVHKEQ